MQDMSGRQSLDSIHIPNTQMCVDIGASTVTSVQSKELGSLLDDQTIKVRKPYTITKQRERWTEEEHEKFLEALKLYGRAWRRIEEHIGTKTAVQIRSHAQKFFSKVVREPCTTKVIEIPPPRPKRKPLHPYPRKLGHSPTKGSAALEQPTWSSMPNPLQSEQENRSPVSVLSAVASDMMGLTASNPANGCVSPVSSATGSNPEVVQPIEQEIGCQSPTSSVDVENPDSASTGSIAQDRISMEFNLSSKDQTPAREGSLLESQTRSLKLFGRTVLVTGSQRRGSSGAENMVQIDCNHKSADMDVQSSAPPVRQTSTDGSLLGAGPCKSSWSPWHGGLAPRCYCLPSHGDPMKSAEAAIPLPWWWASFYGSPPSFPFISIQSWSSTPGVPPSCAEGSADRDTQKEGSWTGSSSISGGGGDRSCDVVESQGVRDLQETAPAQTLKRSANSAFVSLKAKKESKPLGFVPYRRCVAEKRVEQHPQMGGGGRDGQSVGLCL